MFIRYETRRRHLMRSLLKEVQNCFRGREYRSAKEKEYKIKLFPAQLTVYQLGMELFSPRYLTSLVSI